MIFRLCLGDSFEKGLLDGDLERPSQPCFLKIQTMLAAQKSMTAQQAQYPQRQRSSGM